MSAEFHPLNPQMIVDDDVACGKCQHSVPDWHCRVDVWSKPGRNFEPHAECHCDLCDCRILVEDIETVGDVQGPTI